MNPDEQNYKKALILKIVGIIFIIFIFFLWLANLRNVFEDNKKGNDQTWQKITGDIDDSLDRLNKISDSLASSSIDNNKFVKEVVDRANSTTTVSSIATSTIKVEIKEELLDLIKKATTTVKNNCPEYINCMPTIGGARPCTIPAGCENITQIAY